ncbi:Bifunctional epoxide hydrolase 2 [Trichoplax sp. H2]|nr:Bifunctional epoxide hydrolase 2 [Trichoplax sp. H2]|eukprot:RDD36349.1 Bifunctional epoxide hydrolase 2 [Trichoplax sp. H2]
MSHFRWLIDSGDKQSASIANHRADRISNLKLHHHEWVSHAIICNTVKYKVVMFDFYGVLYSSFSLTMSKVELDHGLPKNFILGLFMRDSPEKPSSRLVNGQITFTEFLPLFEKQLTEASIAQGVQLPESFHINDFFADCIGYLRPNQLVLDSISNLQEAGYKVCFLGNIGLIDGPTGNKFTRMKMYLRFTCDYYFESCQVGMSRPDPKFYQHALKEINVEADEAILY